MHRLIHFALAFATLVAGCAGTDRGTPKEHCEKDTRARYQDCMNPTFIPDGEPFPLPKSEESQSCHIAYQQALSTCDGDTPVPLFPIGTSTSSAAQRY